jgi:hypothetical protein
MHLAGASLLYARQIKDAEFLEETRRLVKTLLFSRTGS